MTNEKKTTKKGTKKNEAPVHGAIIDWVAYTASSDNTKLLEMLSKARWDKDQKKMVDVPFLPIETVYTLLEQMYPNYEVDWESMTMEKSFKVNKQKYDYSTKKKESVTEEVFLFTKKVTIYLEGKNNGWRILTWEAKWVATIWQITSDQMYNGFNMKQEARAIKNALKKVGRLFRINDSEEDSMEKNWIKEELGNETTISTFDDFLWGDKKTEAKVAPTKTELEDKVIKALKDKLEGKEPIAVSEYMKIAWEIKRELGIQDGTDDKDTMVKVVQEFKEFYTI